MSTNLETDVFKTLDEALDLGQITSDSDNDGDEDQTSKSHKRLLHDISTITGVPNRKEALRSEPAPVVDEHLWSQKDGNNKVELNDLLDSVPKTTKLGSFKTKIAKLEKSQSVLDAPLSKPEKEKIQRTIAYAGNKQEIGKWEPTVLKNRQADNLSFPLNAYKLPEATTKSVAVNFKPRSSLEKEIAAVLKGSSGVLERKNKQLTESEEKALQAVDLEEAKARRKELQKLRVLQSYYEAKCKRLKKIKSKKFRKIQRKSEQKKKEKELKEVTEEGDEEISEEIERNRVLERAHLRHRNTSKWAKKLMIKGKNKSVEEKQLLHDQLQVSRQLTEQKTYELESDEEIEPNANEELTLLKKMSEDDKNPWLLGQESEGKYVVAEKQKLVEESSDESSSEDEKEVRTKSDDEWDKAGETSLQSGKYSETGVKKKRGGKLAERDELDDSSDSGSDEAENDGRGHVVGKTTNGKFEMSFDSTNQRKGKHGHTSSSLTTGRDSFLTVEAKALDVNVFITDNSDLDFAKSAEQRAKVREAFASDAVMEEFENEKKKEEEKRTPKDVDLTLPGWGAWGGAAMDNEKILRRKRKAFVKKGKKQPPARDKELKHVILNEDKNKRFVANQSTSSARLRSYDLLTQKVETRLRLTDRFPSAHGKSL
eukprot:gene17249-8809_t